MLLVPRLDQRACQPGRDTSAPKQRGCDDPNVWRSLASNRHRGCECFEAVCDIRRGVSWARIGSFSGAHPADDVVQVAIADIAGDLLVAATSSGSVDDRLAQPLLDRLGVSIGTVTRVVAGDRADHAGTKAVLAANLRQIAVDPDSDESATAVLVRISNICVWNHQQDMLVEAGTNATPPRDRIGHAVENRVRGVVRLYRAIERRIDYLAACGLVCRERPAC